ncbi:DUF7718 family protein [Pseudoclavibacter helvolus]|uniref:DUF7718 domain-containing protein n=1 Tax=Pseudoclavibacter helvolus TaxID=255205 RepID=A0A7W4USY2_9MICO|nr:hypothetical protein [Pseudoclavibacter helvolus]MBB2958882.1 hypothetical protein [Pseudoclavibacter helvolus]MBB2959519.1 hypothetical protein [Pseudoclavibacter helvolus]
MPRNFGRDAQRDSRRETREALKTAIEDVDWVYKRPVNAELEMDCALTLGDAPGQSVYIVQWGYKGKVVDFALTHRSEETVGKYDHIARYDCCHSEVHKHQYTQEGEDQNRTVIAEIRSDGTAWDTVNESYEFCYDDMFDHWQEHLRRWSE